MINAQRFSYPNIKPALRTTSILPDVFNTFKIVNVVWESILGKNNKELTTTSLANSPKFITYLEKTRKDFKINKRNFIKYPKMNESDWK